MRLISTLILASALAPAASAQVWVGGPAPDIEVDTWFNGFDEAETISELRGKVIMLEFWATW